MDKFRNRRDRDRPASSPCNDYGKGIGVVMGYFDGNTTTAFWNYAQHFAMSDNSYGTMFGPSAVGAINLIAGTTADGDTLSDQAQRRHGKPIRQYRQRFDDGRSHRRPASGRRRLRAHQSRSCRRPRWFRSPERTSAICSTRRTSRGDGSRAVSLPRATIPRDARFAARITRVWPAMMTWKPSATTFRTMNLSNTTPTRRIFTTFSPRIPR